ncbi:MAG TPA: DUF3105 domain-containing protein [Mycobacteriales bacterium]|nr:DUF3105 domain-containing protein [Mycobacteriales bacterium]
MAKRSPENDRRRIIEEQRRKARAQERRKTILTIVISALVGLALIGGSVYFSVKSKKKNEVGPLNGIGVTADAAGCSDAKSEEIPNEATGAAKHTQRDGDHVDYKQAPPTSGQHNPTPLPVGAKKFYSRDENPPPERAVHNLEHAYTVVWYDKKATDAQIDALKQAADAAVGKFLVVPWDRADFPDDKHIVITAWGERQQCSDVSGAVMQEFMDKYGGNNGKAPEKGAI